MKELVGYYLKYLEGDFSLTVVDDKKASICKWTDVGPEQVGRVRLDAHWPYPGIRIRRGAFLYENFNFEGIAGVQGRIVFWLIGGRAWEGMNVVPGGIGTTV